MRSEYIVDAVDGSDGSTVLAMNKGNGVALLRIEPAGRVSLPTVLVTDHAARSVRLSRDAPGTVLVAWTEQSADRSEASLWLVRASEDGRPLGDPVRIDTAEGEQPVADVAVANSRQGPVVSWDPIVSHGESGGGHDVTLGVSLRVFASTAGGVFAKAREVNLTSHAGPIASVGGYVLSNHVKALRLGSDVVLAWENEGRQFASLASSWNPIDLGASDKDDESRLVSLGPTEVALVSARSAYGDAGDSWPTLGEIRLRLLREVTARPMTCGSRRRAALRRLLTQREPRDRHASARSPTGPGTGSRPITDAEFAVSIHRATSSTTAAST